MNLPNMVLASVEALKSEKILAYPTETVWGFGVDIRREQAIENLFQFKERSELKAMSLLVRDINMAKAYAVVDQTIEKMMQIFWPGPLTFVIRAKANIPSALRGGSEFIGFRCSSHPFVRQLMAQYESPITTTSANLKGILPAKSFEELSWVPKDKVHAVHWTGAAATGQGSTVIRFDERGYEILRAGDLPVELFENILRKALSITMPRVH